jgi:multidrug efflux system outer membrane protein
VSPGEALKALAATIAAASLAGCAVGPDYARPETPLPAGFAVPQSAAAMGERWWTLFGDPALEALVDEALSANRDLAAAAERIEQVRARYVITRADQLPAVGVRGSASRDRSSERTAFPPPADAIESEAYRLVLSASWELDFWGKYRRASEAARAELAATEAGRDAIRASLVGEVTRGYFSLRALDASREVALRTLEGRRKSLELQRLRLEAGVVSELEVRQVESDVAGAEALVPLLERRRDAQEGALAVLAGRTPRDVFAARVARGAPSAPPAVEVPAGLPSDLLLRRPDLRDAEERLKAANARIGVARAAYFPSITLTGFLGGESQSLSDLFSGPARTWSVAAGLLQPVYGAGQIAAGVDLAEAGAREATLAYQQAIANAFREVRDAIGAQATTREALRAQRERERVLARAVELARLRHEGGAVSLFDLLEAERRLLAVRLEAIDAERDRLDAIVDLYLSLGG